MLKVITKKINNTDEYSITRYSISGIILKTIIFLILYIDRIEIKRGKKQDYICIQKLRK